MKKAMLSLPLLLLASLAAAAPRAAAPKASAKVEFEADLDRSGKKQRYVFYVVSGERFLKGSRPRGRGKAAALGKFDLGKPERLEFRILDLPQRRVLAVRGFFSQEADPEYSLFSLSPRGLYRVRFLENGAPAPLRPCELARNECGAHEGFGANFRFTEAGASALSTPYHGEGETLGIMARLFRWDGQDYVLKSKQFIAADASNDPVKDFILEAGLSLPQAFPELFAALAGDDGCQRIAAAAELPDQTSVERIRALLRNVRGEDFTTVHCGLGEVEFAFWEDWRDATGSGAAPGQPAPGMAAVWREMVKSFSWSRLEDVRDWDRIPIAKTEVFPAVFEALRTSTGPFAADAVSVLGDLGPIARPALPEVLSRARAAAQADDERAWQFVWTAGAIGPEEPEVMRLAAESLGSGDFTTRLVALRILARFGTAGADSKARVLALTDDPKDVPIREQALATLTAIAPKDPRTEKALLQALDDASLSVRVKAVEGLVAMGLPSRKARKRVAAVMMGKDRLTAWQVVGLLEKVGDRGIQKAVADFKKREAAASPAPASTTAP